MATRGGNQELETAIFRALRKAILFAVGLYILFRFLDAVTFLVLFFGLVLLLAAALNPVVAWLGRLRVPRPVSAALIGLLFIGGIGVALWIAVPPLIDQSRALTADAPTLWNTLRERFDAYMAQYPELRGQVPTWDDLQERAGPYLTRMLGQVGRYAANVVAVLVSLILLVILVIYTLANPQPLVAGVLAAVPDRHRSKAERILSRILQQLKSWALGSLFLGLVMGLLTWAGLQFIFKLPFAPLFGVIAGIGELIPNLGPILSAIPPILVALAQEPGKAAGVAIFFIVIQQLENLFLVPMVMGRTLNLHPLSIAFMMLMMGALFGVVGAIIAVPAATVLKVLYEELYLGSRPHDPDAILAQSERVVADSGEA